MFSNFTRIIPVFYSHPLNFNKKTLTKDIKRTSMGYYDFNDHFWSPREVCGQATKVDTQAQLRIPTLRRMLQKLFSNLCSM